MKSKKVRINLEPGATYAVEAASWFEWVANVFSDLAKWEDVKENAEWYQDAADFFAEVRDNGYFPDDEDPQA